MTIIVGLILLVYHDHNIQLVSTYIILSITNIGYCCTFQ